MLIETLKSQYDDALKRATRLRDAVSTQLAELMTIDEITLAIPMESRVKSWQSIEEKHDRKQLSLPDIESLDDLIGIRLILLFRSELSSVEELILQTFDVKSREDTAVRLEDARFGYQSRHYVVQLPRNWLSIPTMSDLGSLRVEIQVRTLAQHVWAAASHKLQYKREASVPLPLRRTIYRISALLETVDLEFDRILEQRRDYCEVAVLKTNDNEPLNVDLLASVLNEALPRENRDSGEPYSELLCQLFESSVETAGDLRHLLNKHYDRAMAFEKEQVKARRASKDFTGATKPRTKSGVFFTHAGLTRFILAEEFGSAPTAGLTDFRPC